MTVYQAKDSIHIGCYSDILELIYERSPNSMVYWDRNGKAITNKTTIKDAITDRYSWFKIQAQLNDSGVYSCSVHTLNVKFRPIQVTSVMVKTESAYTFVGFKGELFTFRSNNEVLAFLYDNLELTWLHNGIPSEKYTEIYLPLVNTKEIALDMDDTGEWECTIRHKIFNMKWHTNWVKIKVKYRNEFVKYLMDDNQYTKHVFKDFEPLYVEISFAILVILVAILSFGAAGLLSYCQRILRRQWKDLFRVIHDKLRGESSYQGHIPHTSSESNSQQVSDFSISSSMSSGDKRYIQKEEEPTIYYLTDEDVTVTDSTDNLGLKRTVKRRKILRDVAHSKKHPRSYGAKREESHKNSNVRRERVLTLRREQKARREQMSESSSDSYNSIYTYEPDPYNNYHLTLDLLNYHQRAKKALGIISPEASTHDIQGGKNKKRDLHMNSDETSLQLLEKQLAKNEKVNKEEENPYINFAGKSQFHTDRHVHKKRGVYWRKLADYNTDDSEYSFDSDSYYSVDMDSLVLASTDSEISDAEIF
ncbi:unnamed protein product [Nezara viridula]|uniref:Ig-like domain-containing protein n=1 Tax=Nezara viridula TaxID=85310 RepID=A0A9P0EEK4_NEZVI|nr:unnamed protein product [Nezara viridula]